MLVPRLTMCSLRPVPQAADAITLHSFDDRQPGQKGLGIVVVLITNDPVRFAQLGGVREPEESRPHGRARVMSLEGGGGE